MSIATVITEGYGAFGNVNFVVTQGYGAYDAADERTSGGTYLTAEELRRYKAYWRELNRLETRRFNSSQDRDRALQETVARAYRVSQGIPDPEPITPGGLPPSPARTPEPPTLAARTIAWLKELQPRTDSVTRAALTELFYLQRRIEIKRELGLLERRERLAAEDEEDIILMLLS